MRLKVLFIAIHPDDVELSCGGTTALITGKGVDTFMVDLSPGESSSNGTPEERAREATEAASILGVKERYNLGLPDANIQSENPEQLQKIVESIRMIRPDVVFVPWDGDPHPDHESGGKLIRRALYFSGVAGYKHGKRAFKPVLAVSYIGRLDFEPHIIVDVTDMQAKKMEAIKTHRSQFIPGENRNRTVLNSPDFLPFLEARSRVYGAKIGAIFGEPFRFLHPLSRESLHVLSVILGRRYQGPSFE